MSEYIRTLRLHSFLVGPIWLIYIRQFQLCLSQSSWARTLKQPRHHNPSPALTPALAANDFLFPILSLDFGRLEVLHWCSVVVVVMALEVSMWIFNKFEQFDPFWLEFDAPSLLAIKFTVAMDLQFLRWFLPCCPLVLARKLWNASFSQTLVDTGRTTDPWSGVESFLKVLYQLCTEMRLFLE